MIPFGDPKKTRPHKGDTTDDRERRERVAQASKLFGGSARVKGMALDFTKSTGAAAPSAGGDTTFSAISALRHPRPATRSERLDKLPPVVARLTTSHPGLSLDALETLAILFEKRGAADQYAPVEIYVMDLGTMLGVSTDKAEALLTELVGVRLIARAPGFTRAYTLSV